MKNKNEPIHPIPDLNNFPSGLMGLTKREYFAAMAMQGIVANNWSDHSDANTIENISKDAITVADELLKQLETP